MKLVKLIKKNIKIEDKKSSLKEIIEKQNKILVFRATGGLGDIINTRPIFKTIKSLYPGLHVTYAAPKQYHEILDDHPYIDELIDVTGIDFTSYGYVVNISCDCGAYENFKRPLVDKHRSDIWAEISLGMPLIDHDFCFQIDLKEKEAINNKIIDIYKYKNRPRICIVAKSASPSKDLEDEKVVELVELMKRESLFPIIVGTSKQRFIKEPDCLYINDISLKELKYLFLNFDYIISVDTGAFHLASALNIPTVGIFAWTDSKILSKYHSKVALIQRHRNDNKEFDECPCWSWAGCKYKIRGKPIIPLRCIREISALEILQELKGLMSKYPHENK